MGKARDRLLNEGLLIRDMTIGKQDSYSHNLYSKLD